MPTLSVAPHFCDLLNLIAKKRYPQRESHSEKRNMEKNGVKTEKRNISATGHISRIQTTPRKAYFRLCNSCFWCASYLLDIGTVRCPSCKTEIIESMPISPDERFAFHHDRKRGVSLEFLTT
jgi:predicted Zn-ribbon and HTH transcriptional regulator